jgi:predicted alpha/beta-fold hydrolase
MPKEFDPQLHCLQSDWSQLHLSARQFLADLDLSSTHPSCQDEKSFRTDDFIVPTLEDLPNRFFYEREMSVLDRALTVWFQVAPALLAMSELWLRLFAFILAPAIVVYFVTRVTLDEWILEKVKKCKEGMEVKLLLLGLASSLVLLTDTMYVQLYGGRRQGASMFFIMIILTIKRSIKLKVYRQRLIGGMIAIVGLSIYLIAVSEKNGNGDLSNLPDPGLDLPTVEPGLYYSEKNEFMSKVAQIWPVEKRTYDIMNGATPYLLTGDSLTGIPFLINKSEEIAYHRVWVQNKVDNEAVALDIKFPSDGVHSTRKPIFLILHGLSGGSHEEYVRDFVARRSSEGHTCIVMIARGMMDTPVMGWNVFHGARILDIETAAKTVAKARGKSQLLAGVGYSMGAIVLSNYVARSGDDCHLDTAMAISGGLDMREMLNFKRSMRLWQPMLAQTLRDEFIVSKFDSRFRQRLSKEEHLSLMRSSSVSEIDIYAIVSYNGYDSLEHYYADMSAMGDTSAFKTGGNTSTTGEDFGRIANVSIPFCVLHALDDPLTTWRTAGKDPFKLVNSGSGQIMLLLTKSGGHVGFPMGLNPQKNGWKFMNDAVSSFVKSVDSAKFV